MAKELQKAAVWMSRDLAGENYHEVWFWRRKPDTDEEEQEYSTSDEDRDYLDNLDAVCDEFTRFCKIFGVKEPARGELVKVTVTTQLVQELDPRTAVVKQLRAAADSSKAATKKLLKQAAELLEDSNAS